MIKPDRRTVDEILQHPRWDPLIATLNTDSVTAPQMRILDKFLAFIEDRQIASIWELNVSECLSFDAGYQSANRLRALKRAMQAVFPGQPAILVLTDAIRETEAANRKPGAAKPRMRALKVSVPADELPRHWTDALAELEAGFDRGGVIAPSPEMIPTYRMKLRQLAYSARKAGVMEGFSTDAIKAYARDMRGRGLAAATQLASFSALKKSARYVGTDPEVLELLSELLRKAEERARKAPKNKYEKLQKTGYSPVAIIDRADDLLKEATTLTCPQSQQAARNTAAALALFSVLPVRLADTRLVLGEHVYWRDGVYALHVTLSKNGGTYDAQIDPRLNCFIDALILRGCDEAWLDQMREDCQKTKRPLFIRNDGEAVGYNYVSDCWRRVYETGEHIARTILHTFLGVERGIAGTDMAMAACGQTSPATAAKNQAEMVGKARRLQGQKSLAGLVDDTHMKLFEFI
ncbi:hypothetical protein J7394_19830 [Ruegeria sp. R13_0]|uniref:hypothetical protein n=1 Tax=Ruegeria sp. R13_0 TaxID=2821099 RepID=UPI001ADAC5E6|nr:hypothetical protein [Ruegeria sp. R13_0]MBO9436474.1 hypothetical protein [Ruegeria sp. R13_0]